MKSIFAPAITLTMFALAMFALAAPAQAEPDQAPYEPGMVRCANLVYGNNKSSVCFSHEFLNEIGRNTHIAVEPKLHKVNLESVDLYNYPFAVMTGEGTYSLTAEQRENLRMYLQNGGFVIASAGCSSKPWTLSFRREIAKVFPEVKLKRLADDHPVFQTVYQISSLDCKKSKDQGHLEGLEIDGKIVLIFSSDGLNDTSKVGGKCCCCGGNEIKNARQVNVNLFTYALTH